MKVMVSACLAGENCKYARSNEESVSPCLHERPFDECRVTECEVMVGTTGMKKLSG